VLLLVRDPFHSLMGAAVVIAGIPVYRLVFRRQRLAAEVAGSTHICRRKT